MAKECLHEINRWLLFNGGNYIEHGRNNSQKFFFESSLTKENQKKTKENDFYFDSYQNITAT